MTKARLVKYPKIKAKGSRQVVSSGKGQVLHGKVVSVKTPKTATVLIERQKMHPRYQKSFTRSKKYLAHDEIGVVVGDVVDIMPRRPISKNKHFQIISVVGRDIKAIASEQLKEEAEEAIAEVMPEKKESETPTEDKKEVKQKKGVKSKK